MTNCPAAITNRQYKSELNALEFALSTTYFVDFVAKLVPASVPDHVAPCPRDIPATSSIYSAFSIPLLQAELRTEGANGHSSAEQDTNTAVVQLLEEWMADTSDYDVKTWPEVKKGIEVARTSARARFGQAPDHA